MKKSDSINSGATNYVAKGAMGGAMAGAMGLACTGVLAMGFVYNGRDSAASMLMQVMWMVMMCGGSGAVLGAGGGAMLGMIWGAISSGGANQATSIAASPPQVTSRNRLRSAISGAIIAVSGVAACGTMMGVRYGGLDSTGKNGSALMVAILIALGAAMIGGWLGAKDRSIQ